MAAKWQTRAYGRAFVELLEAARQATEHPGAAVVEALTLLMLHGPQTLGEPCAGSGRPREYADVAEVETALGTLAAGGEPLAAELPRQAGQKENRWTQLLA